jgi:opacity protein-like surface antigen
MRMRLRAGSVEGLSMRDSFGPTLLVFAAATALAPQARAGDEIAYLGLRGSYVVAEESQARSEPPAGLLDYDAEFDNGFGAGLFMGWVMDENFRFEIEGMYRNTNFDTATVVREDSGVPYALPGDVISIGGDVQSYSAMANLYYDLHVFEGSVLPWIGAGIGGVFLDYSVVGSVVDPLNPPPATYPLFDAGSTSWVFGYQFMAGVTFPIADAISMAVGYRFFQTQDIEYSNPAGEEYETDVTLHSVDVALQFHLR